MPRPRFAAGRPDPLNREMEWGHAEAGNPVKLAGLTARSVLVLDENDRVLHAELVSEITNEPDYDAALAVLK